MEPVNKNASLEARKLLQYLYDVAGKQIITGQHTQSVAMEEIDYIKDQTGKTPKLRGFELLSYSPNIKYEGASYACLKEVYENRNTLKVAKEWALKEKGNGILAFTFHWFSPLYGEDKSFYTEHTAFDPEKVLVTGTAERKAFFDDMDVIAKELAVFRDLNIPILWRPFHESEGKWFWWGSKGPAVAAQLYKLMFDYYVNHHHLDNLLWVSNCPLKEGYPGDEYVDVITRDLYPQDNAPTDFSKQYEELCNNIGSDKVKALAEIGRIPDIDLLKKSRIPWAYYMTWSHEFCIGESNNPTERLKRMYASDYAITLD